MLIFGSRVTVAVVATFVYVCGRCHQNAAHHLSKRRRFFTLFFVPLIPMGTTYTDTCVACGIAHVVPKEQALGALAQQPPRAA